MTDSIKFRDDGSVEALLPMALYQAIVRVQAEKGLGWSDGCARAADLIDSGNEKFTKGVKEEARRLHNKELMTELNKRRATIERNIQIRYPCSRCGKDMVWDVRRAKDREQIMGLLKDGGIGSWSHTTCQTLTS